MQVSTVDEVLSSVGEVLHALDPGYQAKQLAILSEGPVSVLTRTCPFVVEVKEKSPNNLTCYWFGTTVLRTLMNSCLQCAGPMFWRRLILLVSEVKNVPDRCVLLMQKKFTFDATVLRECPDVDPNDWESGARAMQFLVTYRNMVECLNEVQEISFGCNVFWTALFATHTLLTRCMRTCRSLQGFDDEQVAHNQANEFHALLADLRALVKAKKKPTADYASSDEDFEIDSNDIMGFVAKCYLQCTGADVNVHFDAPADKEALLNKVGMCMRCMYLA